MDDKWAKQGVHRPPWAGKTGVGKSSTANSVFAEHVASVAAMQSDAGKAATHSRAAAGFTLSIVDTPGALEGDAVNTAVRAARMCTSLAPWGAVSQHDVKGCGAGQVAVCLPGCDAQVGTG